MLRFLADANLRARIVSRCRRRELAIDFLPAQDANLAGVPDPIVLKIAAEQNRVLVTHDFQTMPRHFGDFLQKFGASPGVLLVRQELPTGLVIDELLLIWAASDASEWANRIVRLLPGQ